MRNCDLRIDIPFRARSRYGIMDVVDEERSSIYLAYLLTLALLITVSGEGDEEQERLRLMWQGSRSREKAACSFLLFKKTNTCLYL